jgi:hypothetical protein
MSLKIVRRTNGKLTIVKPCKTGNWLEATLEAINLEFANKDGTYYVVSDIEPTPARQCPRIFAFDKIA